MLKKRYIKSRKVCKVTFELPKAELPEGIEAESVCLAGEFNGWDPAATPMTRDRKGGFRVTLELDPGREYPFRYLVNGIHWYNDWHADTYAPNGFGEDNCVVVTLTQDEPKASMIDVPVGAQVECADGPCGQSTRVIINPIVQQVTHYVVKEKGFPYTERLVSIDRVAKTSPHRIELRCTKHELARMEPFVETHYIEEQYPLDKDIGSAWFALPYVIEEDMVASIPVEYERIPPGELAVHRGAHVEAADGRVGRVDEFLVDPANGQISHLILREGHLWGQKDVVIPIAEIDRTEENVVYLKLDKHSIAALPPISVRRAKVEM